MDDSVTDESRIPAEQTLVASESEKLEKMEDPSDTSTSAIDGKQLALAVKETADGENNSVADVTAVNAPSGDTASTKFSISEEKSSVQKEVPMDSCDSALPSVPATIRPPVQAGQRSQTPDNVVSIMQMKELDGLSTGTKPEAIKNRSGFNSRPSSAPTIGNGQLKPKPVSIFASLFPTLTPQAAPASALENKSPTLPLGNVDSNEAVAPSLADSETPQDLHTMQKTVKSEAIADAESLFPGSKTYVPMSETVSGATGEVVKSVSPLTIQLDNKDSSDKISPGVIEKMDVDSDPKVEKLPPTTRAKSNSPKSAPPLKITLPIAGKTIKKEQRKPSNSSPTIPGEPKKAQRNKSTSPKSKKKPLPPKDDSQDGRNDFYCWVCHKEGEVLCCELCPRVFHAKCLNMTEEPEGDWFCPECEKITEAECKDTQSRAMSMLTIEQFSLLLKYVIQRMKIPMSEPFHDPVDTKMFPDYRDYVFHPMDLTTIEKNVKKKKYGCPEAFLSEFKWVVHNCVIYNSPQSKLTQTARAMVKVAERELGEIEVCPECYLNSCRKRENWFCEPCKELHPLVWAKLQGFPHWPAKALRIEKGVVDVRFFGQHDRAWIPLSGCYLISKELPLPVKNKKKNKGPGLRGGLDGAMQEMQGYIENIKKITGEFEYAPPRTLLTHCDLYRKTTSAKSNQSGKQSEGEGKPMGGLAKLDQTDGKAKIELKDITAGKEMIKARLPMGPTTPKKGKMVTTSGEHPTRSFATKKKRASMEFLSKTIESCKASLGIEKIQDVKMNSGSDDTTSSSDDDDMDLESGKDKPGASETTDKDIAGSSGVPTSKAAAEEDDSDAELVIDLGDMDESMDASTKDPTSSASKASDGLVKKRKSEDTTDKAPPTKPAIKSILLNAPKPAEKEDRKKMLAKALSEKIGGKRKLDSDAGPPSGNPSVKIRKTIEQQEKRGNSPSDIGAKKMISKEKELKKSLKDNPGKMRPGILKSSVDPAQKKDGSSSEKRMSDSFKHKYKDGSQKPPNKKSIPSDKPGRIDKIPTEADAKKLFNGGRIPRKNPVATISDNEELDHDSTNLQSAMETRQTVEPKRNATNVPVPPNPHQVSSRQSGTARQVSIDQQRKSVDDNVTFASLKKYSDKVMDTVQKVFYEMYTDMMVPLTSGGGRETSTAASATAMHEVAQMRLELERLKWMHEQEIAELKHNHDLTVAEIRQSLEYEKKQLLLEAKVQADAAKNRAIEETKRKQWCAYCNKEAIFYCCWNTSYCDYPCQQKHWPQHMNSCSQARDNSSTTQATGPEIISSPPVHSVSVSRSSDAPTTSISLPSTQTSKPATTTTQLISPGRASITITASAGNLSKLSSGGRPSTANPVSFASVKPLIKTSTLSSADYTKTQVPGPVPVTTQQQKSGSAISAIGARLMAAKQRSSTKEQSGTLTGKFETASGPSLPKSESNTSQSYTDHVITTMESPLSPDTKPPSPRKTSSLVISEGRKKSEVDSQSGSKFPVETTDATSQPSGDKSKKVVPARSSAADVTKPTMTAVDTFVGKIPPSTKPGSKPSFPASKAMFSSPSAVASLIADMGTPLSSTLSSPESSFSDTPEKKPDAPKVQQSLSGSAFSKIISDVAKIASMESSMSIGKKEVDPPVKPPEVATSKPVESKVGAESPVSGDAVSIPLVAPVLTDSYLTNLHKTLPSKTKTPPVEVMEEDPPMAIKPGGLPRPVLPESDEDKTVRSDSKLSDSDIGELMETDGKT